jgi:aspartate ammonia-lyase
VPISHYPEIVHAFAFVKKPAALANHECDPKAMPKRIAKAIAAACDDLLEGELLDQFAVDVFQGGAGTSVNMNANEVIANRALEHLGRERGDYDAVDPHDHVNPEVVNQVCFKTIGNDLAVTMAVEAGQLHLNVMEPLIAQCIHESIALVRASCATLRVECVEGIEADADRCRRYVEESIGLVTALNPIIGYEAATELAAEALRSGRGIAELVRERGLLDERALASALDPRSMTSSRRR